MPESSVRIERLLDRAHINLRGNPDDTKFVAAAEAALGQALPIVPNTVTDGEHLVCWLGPDEWLVITADDATAAVASALSKSAQKMHAAVNDIGGGQVLLRIGGDDVTQLFSKGCTLDFHDSVFAAGTCAQSGLAKANVLFVRQQDGTFLVSVRRSFSDYLERWLSIAGREFGIEFS